MREGDSVESFIKDSRGFLDQIKVRQQVGGINVLHYLTGTNDLYDLHVFSNVPQKVYRLTFIFGTAKSRALLGITAYYRIDNPNVMSESVEPTAVAPQISVNQDDTTPYLGDRYIVDYYIINNSYSGIPTDYDVYIKFFAEGTDTGTWSIEQIS